MTKNGSWKWIMSSLPLKYQQVLYRISPPLPRPLQFVSGTRCLRVNWSWKLRRRGVLSWLQDGHQKEHWAVLVPHSICTLTALGFGECSAFGKTKLTLNYHLLGWRSCEAWPSVIQTWCHLPLFWNHLQRFCSEALWETQQPLPFLFLF